MVFCFELTFHPLEAGGDVWIFHRRCCRCWWYSGIDHSLSWWHSHVDRWRGQGGGLLLLLLGGEVGGWIDFFLWFQNCDGVIQRDLRSHLSLGIVREHDGDSDSDNALSHENVTHGGVRVDLAGMSGLDHVAIAELHALGTLSAELSGDDDLATLGGGLHHEPDHTVARTSHGQPSQQLELEGFGLGLGAEAAVLHALGVQLDGAIGEFESLLHDGGQLADAASVLSQHALGAGGADDDLGSVRGGADLNSGVSVLGQFAIQQLVQFGVEDSISDKLALR
mmetsp:Transcript_15213/g.42884  ORF Transcript_15213/g.42884 Transcript_15213/m.42884 type:complete len:280 (-) Transcript_15213:156-995(-)